MARQPKVPEGVQPSLLDDDQHPTFDTWETLDTLDSSANSWAEPLSPINWNTLGAEEAEAEWLDLNAWVNWLRGTYGLAPTVLPPMWHRHDELVWELSALHLHWLNSYSRDASPSSPLGWHRDFADARNRLRDWVAACGTRLDRDRPTRHTRWPGEPSAESNPEAAVIDRDADFIQFVMEDVTARRHVEEHVTRRAS